MSEEQSSVYINAQGGSVISGKTAVVGNLPHGTQKPDITASVVNRRSHPRRTVHIDAFDANISVADDTALFLNIQPPKGKALLPTDQSTLPCPMNVTGGEASGGPNLHFFVHEQGKYIQIGQSCLIVEMQVNDRTMESLKAKGTLEIESKIGASLVTMKWRGFEFDKEELRTKIKVQLTESLLGLERTVLHDLVANQCDKCQQLVTFLMKEVRGYLLNISLGCIQLALFFSSKEDLQRGRSPEAISKIQKFLDKLLLTEQICPMNGNVRFVLTLLEQEDFTNKNDANVYNREKGKTFVSGISADSHSISEDEKSLIIGQTGIITVDEFTRQVVQIKNFLKDELVQILRNVIIEESQGVEKRILENISKSLDKNVFSSVELESPSVSKRSPRLLKTDRNNRDSGIGPGISPCPSTKSLTNYSEAGQLDITNLERDEVEHREDKGPARLEKQRTSATDSLYSYSGNEWQAANVVDETQYDEETDQWEGDMVDFSPLFDAVNGKRAESGQEKFQEHHKTLKEIWGEDSLNVVQQALARADHVTRELNDDEKLDQFCTILCVDLSHSMAGEPFEEQRTVAKKIINACMGYIGLVSFGSETKVEQELTKNKESALKIMGQLEIDSPVSRSPVLQGLFTVLQLLNGRVRPTNYGPHHTVYPKIVIISDGFFNDCSPNSERELFQCKKTNELLISVLEVLVAMSIRIPIYFVPIGKKMGMSHRSFNILSRTHEWFSKLSVVEDVELLFDSKKRETSIARVMKAIMWPPQPETALKSWQTTKEELTENHTGKEIRHIEWFITESFKRPPPVGTRVQVAGSKPQTTGTILCHIEELKRKLIEKVLVVLDTGETGIFSWSLDQQDLLFYKQSMFSDGAEFTVGLLIREGGECVRGDLGVVIENEYATLRDISKTSWPRGTVKVCWRLKLSKGDGCLFHKKNMIKHAESPLIDLTGLIASKTMAHHFAK